MPVSFSALEWKLHEREERREKKKSLVKFSYKSVDCQRRKFATRSFSTFFEKFLNSQNLN